MADQDVLDALEALRTKVGAQQQSIVPFPGVPYTYGHPPTNTLGLNEKLLYDDTFADVSQLRKQNIRFGEAWETLRITQAQLLAIVAHQANANIVIQAQSGGTQNQFGNQPQQQGAASNVAAGAVPANRATDQASAAIAAGVAESVQNNVTTQISALTQQIGVLGGTLTTILQAVNTGNAVIAAALAQLIQNAKQAPATS